MMRMSIAIATAFLVAAFGAAGALAEDEQPQPAPIPTPEGGQNPWPGKQADIFFYVETLTGGGGESVFGKNAPTSCTQTNFFARGERIVWHIAAVNAKTGIVLTNKQVKYAYIKIPVMKLKGWKKDKVAKWTQVPLDPELLTILDNRKFYP